MRYLERQILLQIIDNRWREHLYEMDYLREGIHLRGFAQIDPLVAYKNEGFTMFQELMNSIWEEFARVDLPRRGRTSSPPDFERCGPTAPPDRARSTPGGTAGAALRDAARPPRRRRPARPRGRRPVAGRRTARQRRAAG